MQDVGKKEVQSMRQALTRKIDREPEDDEEAGASGGPLPSTRPSTRPSTSSDSAGPAPNPRSTAEVEASAAAAAERLLARGLDLVRRDREHAGGPESPWAPQDFNDKDDVDEDDDHEDDDDDDNDNDSHEEEEEEEEEEETTPAADLSALQYLSVYVVLGCQKVINVWLKNFSIIFHLCSSKGSLILNANGPPSPLKKV